MSHAHHSRPQLSKIMTSRKSLAATPGAASIAAFKRSRSFTRLLDRAAARIQASTVQYTTSEKLFARVMQAQAAGGHVSHPALHV